MFLNISFHEWGRVVPAFMIKLLSHTAFVAGSTILMALFIEKYEVAALPRLFILQALFIILGTTLFIHVLKKLPSKISIIAGSVLAAFCLFLTGKCADGSLFFFFYSLLGISVFLAQVNIWVSLFIEDLFSPLEGERILPVVESAEPIGGICAGILLVSLIGKVPTGDMFLAVGIVLLVLALVLAIFLRHLNSVPVLQLRNAIYDQQKNHSVVPNIKKVIYKSRFLYGLFLVIFLQFFVFHFVEFQFAKQMDESARHHSVAQTEAHSDLPETLPEEYTVAHFPSHAESLMHALGAFHIGIHLTLFLVQLLLASAILRKFGVMRSFLLGPLLSFCSFLSLLFGFNLLTSLLSKGTYEVANGISRSAFCNTFYALPDKIRDEAKEMLEGYARPLGLLAGTVSLLILQQFLAPEGMLPAIAIILITVSACGALLANSLQIHYSQLSRKKFEFGENLPEKLNAVEILSQKGHRHAKEFLIERLCDTGENAEIRKKILEVVGRAQKTDCIPHILSCCHDKNPGIRLAAVDALMNYEHLGDKFFSQAFSRYSVITSLKEIIATSKDKKLKLAAIKVFANLNDPEIIPFLIEMLQTNDAELLSEAISVCGLFHDSATISHIEPFLENKNPKVVAAAIVALWQFMPLRLKLVMKMSKLLESNNIEAVVCGLDAVGDTRSVQEKRKLEQLMEHEDERIRRHAILALAKLNEYHVLNQLIDFIFHEEKAVSLATRKLVLGLEPQYRQSVEKRIIFEVGERVTQILKNAGTSVLEYLPTAALEELLHLFTLINAERECWNIKLILAERANGSGTALETVSV